MLQALILHSEILICRVDDTTARASLCAFHSDVAEPRLAFAYQHSQRPVLFRSYRGSERADAEDVGGAKWQHSYAVDHYREALEGS